ncbi:MAG: hypothetical protein HYS80_00150 [Candidatus Aenigmarchaeota archaeon]|nr:hypothetical protein [Candidatus Aenigmarchaeota archaeon]
MLKGSAATNALTIVGVGLVSVIMFAQVPDMVKDIRLVLSKDSVIAKSAEIADLLTRTASVPGDIKITHKLSDEVSYTISIKNGYVNISTENDWAVSKTFSNVEFESENVKSLLITKTSIIKVE